MICQKARKESPAMLNRVRIIGAVVLMALGLLWSLQGAGLVGGSFMTGSSAWLIIGIALVAAGLVLLMQGLLLRR
jgi:hypothetical protein